MNKVQIKILNFDNIYIAILSKYFNYSNIFLTKNTLEF